MFVWRGTEEHDDKLFGGNKSELDSCQIQGSSAGLLLHHPV